MAWPRIEPVAGGVGLGAAELTAPVVAEYLVARRAAGYTAYRTPKALAPLLAYLRGLGVAPLEEIIAPGGRPRRWRSGSVATCWRSGG